jgi:hypothetical protein
LFNNCLKQTEVYKEMLIYFRHIFVTNLKSIPNWTNFLVSHSSDNWPFILLMISTLQYKLMLKIGLFAIGVCLIRYYRAYGSYHDFLDGGWGVSH